MSRILLLTDPNSFASLVLLNSKWRRVSQQAHLYAHHLAKCPSHAASHAAAPASSATDAQLPRLRSTFAREVKRNLFEAYLRPSETRITLISNSISSSSCPGGEGLQFNASPKGHHVLAYNSSRIYVIDVREPSVQVKREFKILRRPVAACIQDDASLLAALSSDMQVDVFDLKESPPKRLQSILLDNRPRTIALSPCGSVLAAAYEGGIEVTSLNPGTMAAKRAVKCEPVDTLAFSFDGTQLLGTTTHSLPPNTVILTAPYYDPSSHMGQENASALWTTSILFPNTSRDCSHAILLQDSDNEEASWTFTYDRSFETFRAVRIDDLRNGTTYFTGPVPSTMSQARLLPCTLPASSYHGELVAAGFQGKDVWLYGVPEDVSAVPDQSLAPHDGASLSSGSRRSAGGHSPRVTPRMQGAEPARVPQWQVLCDKLRNTFIGGKKVTQLEGASYVKWVAGFGGPTTKERLVIAARGVNPNRPITEEDDFDFVDGGRITLLDFDYGTTDGKRTEVTIEVGTNEPEPLEEEQRDMETEVALVRRRTVAQRRGNARSALLRGETVTAAHPPLPTRSNSNDDDDDPLQPRRIGVPPRVAPRVSVSEEGDELEEQEALDAPYTQGTPRSGPTLRRAATAAAMTRRLRLAPGEPGYRRADGRAEHPHESDADNWVPPPPPYQKEPSTADLPAFLRHPAVTPAGLSNQVRPPPSSEHQGQLPRQARGQQERRTHLPAAGRYHWPPVPPLPRNMTDPLSLPTADQQLATVPNAHNRVVSEGTPQMRRSSIPRPRSDSISDRYTVSPLESPSLRRYSGRRARQWDDNVFDQERSQSPVSDSATESLPYRYSIRGSYSNPLALNPPSSFQTRPGQDQQAEQERSGPAHGEQVIPEEQPHGGHEEQRQAPPRLDLQIPSPTIFSLHRHSTFGSPSTPLQAMVSHSEPPTSLGEVLSGNAGPSSDLTSQPRSAPVRASDAPSMSSSWPPAPRFYQPGTPESASHGKRPEHTSATWRPPTPDQPLIISTPTGLSGAYDEPTRRPSDRCSETPILAPRPRRNVPHTPGTPGPTVGRLEDLFAPRAVPAPPPVPSASTSRPLGRRKSRLARTVSRRSVRVRPRRSVRQRKAKSEVGFSADGWAEGAEDDKGMKKCVVM